MTEARRCRFDGFVKLYWKRDIHIVFRALSLEKTYARENVSCLAPVIFFLLIC